MLLGIDDMSYRDAFLNKKVKIGIIGIGNIGSAHLSCIYGGKVEGMVVTAVCDIDLSKQCLIKDKYPDVEFYENYVDMLKCADIDSVHICVPHPLHVEIAITALNEGKNVLVEKPVDITVTKAKMLNEAAEKEGKVFAIMFNQRTNFLFQKAYNLVHSGELGEIKRSVWIVTNWYRTQHYYNSGSWRATWKGEGGGVLINQAPHNLDLWQWICGMPEKITAFCNTAKFHDIEVEDEATIYAEYENGATGVFITSTGDLPGTNRFEISGTKGKIVIENNVLKHWRLKEDERIVCVESDNSSGNIQNEYIEYSAEEESAHRGILQNFANAVLYGEKLLAPGIEGINELMISNAAYLSEWKGNAKIEIPFDSDEFDNLLNEHIKKSVLKKGEADAPSNSYKNRWSVLWG